MSPDEPLRHLKLRRLSHGNKEGYHGGLNRSRDFVLVGIEGDSIMHPLMSTSKHRFERHRERRGV